jgi:hypothetical protein
MDLDDRLSVSSLTREASSSDSYNEGANGTITGTGAHMSLSATFTLQRQKSEDFALYQHGSYSFGEQSLDSHWLSDSQHSRETYSETGSGTEVYEADTDGGLGGGGVGGSAHVTKTYTYNVLNTERLDTTRSEQGTYSTGNYNLSSYHYDRDSQSYTSRTENGTTVYDPGGTHTYAHRNWEFHDVHLIKDGTGRVNTADGSFTLNTIDTAYFSNTDDGVMTSGYSLNTASTTHGSWAMTDETLQDASGLYDRQIVEWDGPPVILSQAQLEDLKRRRAEELVDPLRAIDNTDAFIAGWGDRLTAGLSTRARAALYGQDAIKNHSGKWFERGQQVGAVHGIALAFVNPCSLGGGLGAAYRGIQAASAAGNLLNARDNINAGRYGAAAWDVVGAAGDIASFMRACFAGEVEVLTRNRGVIRWDQVCEGDWLASCAEDQPAGAVEYRQVEELFRTEAELWHLHLSDGSVIRTTAEHPFWVSDRSPERQQGEWTPAKDLRPGDRLRSLTGAEVIVQEVYFSGETEPVYNARVGEHHTYFVRSPGAGEFVWAHNACDKHHSVFKYILEPVKAAVNYTGRISQSLTKLEPKVHRTLHAVFNHLNPELASWLGKKNIARLLQRELIRPATLFDRMERATVLTLRNGPDLEHALSELRRIRGLLGIPR